MNIMAVSRIRFYAGGFSRLNGTNYQRSAVKYLCLVSYYEWSLIYAQSTCLRSNVCSVSRPQPVDTHRYHLKRATIKWRMNHKSSAKTSNTKPIRRNKLCYFIKKTSCVIDWMLRIFLLKKIYYLIHYFYTITNMKWKRSVFV